MPRLAPVTRTPWDESFVGDWTTVMNGGVGVDEVYLPGHIVGPLLRTPRKHNEAELH